MRCLLGLHYWNTDEKVRWCEWCDKVQELEYDMTYGESYWRTVKSKSNKK